MTIPRGGCFPRTVISETELPGAVSPASPTKPQNPHEANPTNGLTLHPCYKS